jgi:hypothetical protein
MQRGTKNLYAHLDCWFYVPSRPSRARIQISNFEEDKVVSTWRCFYVVTKLIFIHQTTNFYAMSNKKRLSTSWSLILWIQLSITCYFSNFKFLRRRDRLHVLHVRSPCSMYCSHVNYTSLYWEAWVGGGNHSCVRWNVYLVERFLRSNKINFYSFNH